MILRMLVSFVSRDALSPAAKRIVEELGHRRHGVNFPLPENQVFEPGARMKAEPSDVIFNRILGYERGYEHVFDWVKEYEKQTKAPVWNHMQAVENVLSKRKQADIFAKAGLPVPRTLLVGAGSDPHTIFSELGDTVVLKSDQGFGGKGVEKADSIDELAKHLKGMDRGFGVVQEFIAEAGTTLRLIVVKNQIIASASRTAKEDHWQANFAQGAVMLPHTSTVEQQELALTSMQVAGLDIGGVDIIQTHSGPLLLEINPSPGLSGIEPALNQNVAGKMVDVLLESLMH